MTPKNAFELTWTGWTGFRAFSELSTFPIRAGEVLEMSLNPSNPSNEACFGFPGVQVYTTPDGVELAGKPSKSVKSVSKRRA